MVITYFDDYSMKHIARINNLIDLKFYIERYEKVDIFKKI